MFVIQFGVGILSHTEQLGMHCGDGEGWAQEELHCWPRWLKYGWFLLCLLPWKSHLNAESLRDLEQLFPQKMLWFGIYFADEGLESPWKSLSHQDLGSVWSRRNADGSLECPILPVVGIAVLPGQACGMALEQGSSHPSPEDIRAFSTCLCQISQKLLIYLLPFSEGMMKSHLLEDFTGMEPANGLLQVLSQWLKYELLKNPFLCYL